MCTSCPTVFNFVTNFLCCHLHRHTQEHKNEYKENVCDHMKQNPLRCHAFLGSCSMAHFNLSNNIPRGNTNMHNTTVLKHYQATDHFPALQSACYRHKEHNSNSNLITAAYISRGTKKLVGRFPPLAGKCNVETAESSIFNNDKG